MTSKKITFGDTVRIRKTEATTKAGLAGLDGQVFGETVPSESGMDVFGELEDDYAINVYFECRDTDVWFEPTLLEFIDHGAGTEFTLKGAPGKWTRSEDGEWIEHPKGGRPGNSRPWWKFW